jgi:uncharacterized membrane protein
LDVEKEENGKVFRRSRKGGYIMLLNLPFVLSRIEIIDFKGFMRKEHRHNAMSSTHAIPLLSFIPLNPVAMIDSTFIAIGTGVFLIALIEKGLANSDNVGIATLISAFLRISFPVFGLATLWYLVNDLKFLFW